MLATIKKRLARWLYPNDHERVLELQERVKKLLSKNAVDLTRECLVLLPASKERDANVAESYLKEAFILSKNEVLVSEIQAIVHELKDWIATQSATRDSDMIGRGSINGISLLYERINQRAAEWEQIEEDKKSLTKNPHDIT